MSSKAADELGRCVVALLLKEPFYGHLLGGVPRRLDATTATAAVVLRARHVELVVNPHFFMKVLRKRTERVAVLKHEVLHIVLRHLYRMRREFHHPLRFNIAADLVVNQLVAPWKLPKGAILLSTWPALKLKPDQTLEWYYRRLEGESLGQHGDGHGASHCDHGGWAIHGAAGGGLVQEPLSAAEVDALEGATEAWIQRAVQRTGGKGIGSLPGTVRAAIDQWAARRKPKVDWRRTLKMFAQSSRRTRIRTTRRRESRRFEVEEGLPRPPGTQLKRFEKLAVAVDTSGSICEQSLAAFFAEIYGLWRQGAEVTVVECDADIGQIYPYDGHLPAVVTGGGTAFEPVFAWLRTQHGFDGLIYLTDGMAAAPVSRVYCPVLWVLTPGGSRTACQPGRVVELPPVDPAAGSPGIRRP